ncbi:MAG: archease [Thermoplasmata archaeon]
MPGSGRRRWGSFPTTADMGLWATGPSPAALFEALGLGLVALTTDLRRVRPRSQRELFARADDPGALVVAWLGELLLLEQGEGFLAREIEVELAGDPPNSLKARLRGELFDPERHPRRIEVKAATFHRLIVDLARGRARVIVDI